MQATRQAAGSPDKDKVCCRSVQPLVCACCANTLLVSTDATPELSHKVLHLKTVTSPMLRVDKMQLLFLPTKASHKVSRLHHNSQDLAVPYTCCLTKWSPATRHRLHGFGLAARAAQSCGGSYERTANFTS